MPYFQTQPNIRIALGPYGTSMVVLKKNVRYLYAHHQRWLKKERIVGLREKKQTIRNLIIKKTQTNKQ